MKQKLEIEPCKIADVIMHRRYHYIRTWLVRIVDENVIEKLLYDMAFIITEEYKRCATIDSVNQLKGCDQKFLDVVTFLKDCHKYNRNLGFMRIARKVINERSDAHNDIVCHIVPYLVESDAQWVTIRGLIQKKWLSKLSHDDATMLLHEFRSVVYLMTGNVSSALTDMLLTIHDKYYMTQLESNTGNMTSIIHDREEGYSKGVTNILAILNGYNTSNFYTKVLDEGVRLAKEKHPLCQPKYTLGAIWEYCPWYYPANVKDYMVVASYLYVNVNTGHPVELNDRLLPILNRMAYEAPILEFDIIPDIVDYLCELTLRIPDNIRFLAPFRNIRDESVEYSISRTLRNVISDLINPDSGKTLRDFKFLLDNYNSPIILSNDNLQRGFIIHGGKPSTLLKSHLGVDVSSYIYTSEGLTLAINHSTSMDMEILIHDADIVKIMTDEIVGGTYYYNTISYITQAILNTDDITPEIGIMIRKINIRYPVSDGDYDKYRLMITNMRAFDTGITNNDDLLRYLPVGQQSYLRLFADLASNEDYIPLWYGINKSAGINHFVSMDTFRQELTRLNDGYIGDVTSGSLGKILLVTNNSSK